MRARPFSIVHRVGQLEVTDSFGCDQRLALPFTIIGPIGRTEARLVSDFVAVTAPDSAQAVRDLLARLSPDGAD